MSASGPRFSISFPTAFLSLNTPTSKSTNTTNGALASPDAAAVPAHTFLSNKAADVVPRHSSVSSVSSTDSAGSAASDAAGEPVPAAVHAQKVPAFLPLNSKFTAPEKASEVSAARSAFLSNRH